MSTPTSNGMLLLKHLVRYMKTTTGNCVVYKPTVGATTVEVVVDSNWAGCPLTSKSTDCVQVFAADCLVYSSAKTQAIISQSSGEAELMAIHRGACFGFYVSHVWAELNGVTPVIKLFSDSSAARAIATRRGPGRVRHLTVKQLFVQSLTNGRLALHKVPGEDNTADIGTKVLDRKRIDFLLGRMHIVRAVPAPSSGRVSTAKGTTLMALLVAALTPLPLAKGHAFQEELLANSSACSAARHEDGSAPLPFWAFVLLLLLVGALLGELGRRLLIRLFRAPVVASCPWSALGCACDEIYKYTQEEPEATPQRVQEELMESSAPTSARPLVLSMLHVSDQGERWHTRSDCFGLKKATRARALTPCQICARNL